VSTHNYTSSGPDTQVNGEQGVAWSPADLAVAVREYLDLPVAVADTERAGRDPELRGLLKVVRANPGSESAVQDWAETSLPPERREAFATAWRDAVAAALDAALRDSQNGPPNRNGAPHRDQGGALRGACTPGSSTTGGDASVTDIETDRRPKILVDSNLHVVRDDILNVIQDDPALYKRGEVLVKFTRLESDEATLRGGATLKHAKGTYALWPIDEASFACHTAALAYFYKEKIVKGKPVEEQCDPPATTLRAVLRNKTFEGVRPISGVVECPYLTPDNLLCQPGYNADTETVYIPTVKIDPPPVAPTKEDALAAKARIYDFIREFPFKDPDLDRSVWLSALLTAIMRPTMREAVPGCALCGNNPGIGKSMLVDLIGIVATGRTVATVSYPESKEEATKLTVGLALAGAQWVFFDNLTEGSSYGNGVMDSRVTNPKLNERILGGNQYTGEIYLLPNWFLTGNGISPAADAYRRWLMCNLLTELEHPEERKVEREELLEHVCRNRGGILRDCLIILKAHALAGYPKGEWGPLGSFYAWDKLIRACVWWVTGADCNQTRREAANESPERLRKLALLEAIEDIQHAFVAGGQPYANGVTTGEIIALAAETDEHLTGKVKYTYPTLREAVMAFPAKGRESQAQTLGSVIAALKHKMLGGKRLIKNGDNRNHSAIWLVVPSD
jgi:hypothetical protein